MKSTITSSILVAVLGASCSGEGPNGVNPLDSAGISLDSVNLLLVSGNNQSATVGTVVGQPPTVLVRTDGGTVVPGVPVTWAVASGGGSISASLDTTDTQGNSSIVWTLGSSAGAQAVTAAVPGVTGSPVTFDATATAGQTPQPTTLSIESGNNQAGTVNTQLGQPLVVKVADSSGTGMASHVITWVVVTGGGALSASADTTDGSGFASVNWTLGNTIGAQTSTATAPGLAGSPVTFTGNGIAPQAGTTYYLGPTGNDNSAGTSRGAPWATFAHATTVLGPGDELVVLDGTYSQSFASARSGTAGNLIRVRAENDGGAILDGDWQRIPVSIGHDYIEVAGFTTKRGNLSNIQITGDNNIVRRVGAMSVSSSSFAFNVAVAGSFNLLEDVFVWGSFRSGIEFSEANNTVRRCVVKQDATVQVSGNWPPYGVRSYNNVGYAGTLVENCIVLDFDNQIDFGRGRPGAAYRMRAFRVDDVGRWYGNIALDVNTTDQGSGQGIMHGIYMEGRNHIITDMVLINGDYYGYYNDGQNNQNLSITATNVTGHGYEKFTDGGCCNINFVNEHRDTTGLNHITRPHASGTGATIENRYVDGVLTNVPLWPFPNEARIKSEICTIEIAPSGYYPQASPTRGFCGSNKTLTRYIWEYLGSTCPTGICAPPSPAPGRAPNENE